MITQCLPGEFSRQIIIERKGVLTVGGNVKNRVIDFLMMKQNPGNSISRVFPLQPTMIFNIVSPDTFRKIENISHWNILNLSVGELQVPIIQQSQRRTRWWRNLADKSFYPKIIWFVFDNFYQLDVLHVLFSRDIGSTLTRQIWKNRESVFILNISVNQINQTALIQWQDGQWGWHVLSWYHTRILYM